MKSVSTGSNENQSNYSKGPKLLGSRFYVRERSKSYFLITIIIFCKSEIILDNGMDFAKIFKIKPDVRQSESSEFLRSNMITKLQLFLQKIRME